MTLSQYLNLINTPPTSEQIKDAAKSSVASEIANGSVAMLQSMDARHRMEFQRVWAHPILTPQEVVAELGTMAGILFYGNTGTIEYLATQFALAGYDYTPPSVPEWATIIPNQDGTVTIDGVPPVNPE